MKKLLKGIIMTGVLLAVFMTGVYAQSKWSGSESVVKSVGYIAAIRDNLFDLNATVTSQEEAIIKYQKRIEELDQTITDLESKDNTSKEELEQALKDVLMIEGLLEELVEGEN